MKPRIVRASSFGTGLMGEYCGGKTTYLALPWPTECPRTPEAVMAACERNGIVPCGVPFKRDGAWRIPKKLGEWLDSVPVTPEFMGEKCEHPVRFASGTPGKPMFVRCDACGSILQDRRNGERRKGERRGDLGDRRESQPLNGYRKHDRRKSRTRRDRTGTWRPINRRSGKDRRKP